MEPPDAADTIGRPALITSEVTGIGLTPLAQIAARQLYRRNATLGSGTTAHHTPVEVAATMCRSLTPIAYTLPNPGPVMIGRHAPGDRGSASYKTGIDG